jgi:transcriptional regulator with XRE-family HTH domain
MSLQITITPKERAAGRFVSRVRRAIQKALAEERAKNGITQSDIARAFGVNRSVVSRELRGHRDISLSRAGEYAWVLNRIPQFGLQERTNAAGSNLPPPVSIDRLNLAPPAVSDVRANANPQPVLGVMAS